MADCHNGCFDGNFDWAMDFKEILLSLIGKEANFKKKIMNGRNFNHFVVQHELSFIILAKYFNQDHLSQNPYPPQHLI